MSNQTFEKIIKSPKKYFTVKVNVGENNKII